MHIGDVFPATLGERLRTWRQSIELTQEEFAARTGMHIGVLRKYEQGVNMPGAEALVALGATGVDLHWLLTGSPHSGALPASLVQHPKFLEAARNMERLSPTRLDQLLEEIATRANEARRMHDLEQVVRKLSEKLG